MDRKYSTLENCADSGSFSDAFTCCLAWYTGHQNHQPAPAPAKATAGAFRRPGGKPSTGLPGPLSDWLAGG